MQKQLKFILTRTLAQAQLEHSLIILKTYLCKQS